MPFTNLHLSGIRIAPLLGPTPYKAMDWERNMAVLDIVCSICAAVTYAITKTSVWVITTCIPVENQ
jgi:hypothetical protein